MINFRSTEKRAFEEVVNNLKNFEDEELHLIMVDNHIPAGAKLY